MVPDELRRGELAGTKNRCNGGRCLGKSPPHPYVTVTDSP